jgi:hypothetical protein
MNPLAVRRNTSARTSAQNVSTRMTTVLMVAVARIRRHDGYFHEPSPRRKLMAWPMGRPLSAGPLPIEI